MIFSLDFYILFLDFFWWGFKACRRKKEKGCSSRNSFAIKGKNSLNESYVYDLWKMLGNVCSRLFTDNLSYAVEKSQMIPIRSRTSQAHKHSTP